MRAIVLLIWVALFFPAVGVVRAGDKTRGSAVEIGVASRAFEDSERSNWAGTGPRPVRVTIWYPSDGGGPREFVDDNGRQVSLLRDGNIAAARERYPLVMLSHGSGGFAEQVFWLGNFLAQHGYIAASVDHNGTDEEELHYKRPTLTDFFGWERAADLSVALTRLLADSEFGSRIDPARMGAAGFSLGGITALWIAGARLDLEALRLNSPAPPPTIADAINKLIEFSKVDPVALQSVSRANRSYRDSRIKSVFALAPPMGAGFTPDGLRDVEVPVTIVVGDADVVAPAATNAKHFAAHIPEARLVVVPGERGHYLQPTPADQRRAELREVAEMALTFFEKQLE